MANETLQAKGSYANILTGASVATATLSGESDSITTGISGEALYPLLDFKITVSAGTPVVGTTIDIYRRPSDGTNDSPAPVVADYLQNYAGTVVIDNAAVSTYYYLYGVPNPDPADTFYFVHDNGSNLTIALSVRGRTYGTA